MKNNNWFDEQIYCCRKQRRNIMLEVVYNWIGVFALGWFMAILLVSVFIQ